MSEYFRKLRSPDAGGWPPHARGATALRNWLGERRSLSARIAAACPAEKPFNLKLLFSGAAAVTLDEAVLVGARRGERMRVREVQLCAGTTPLVFAHSVTHPRHLLGPWRLMGHLGGGVLGSILFTDPGIRRGPLAFRALDRRHPLYRRIERECGPLPSRLWARRAVFHHQGKPLLVTEVFLPALLHLLLP